VRAPGTALYYDEQGLDMLDHEQIGGVTVVSIRPELDAGSAPRLKEMLNELIGRGAIRFVIDLSDLDFIDSAGLGVLVSTLKGVRARGGDLRICCVKDPVRMIFDLTRLSKVFKIFADRGQALSSFGAAHDATGAGR